MSRNVNEFAVLTGREKHNGLQARVLRRINMNIPELLNLILENPNVIHESDHAIRAHVICVDTGRCKQGSDVQRHRTLGCVQYE